MKKTGFPIEVVGGKVAKAGINANGTEYSNKILSKAVNSYNAQKAISQCKKGCIWKPKNY